jgi:hypothetical protein
MALNKGAEKGLKAIQLGPQFLKLSDNDHFSVTNQLKVGAYELKIIDSDIFQKALALFVQPKTIFSIPSSWGLLYLISLLNSRFM